MTPLHTTEVLVVHIPRVEGLGYMAHVSLREKRLKALWDGEAQKWKITKGEIIKALQGSLTAQRQWDTYFYVKEADSVLFPRSACRPVVDNPAGVP